MSTTLENAREEDRAQPARLGERAYRTWHVKLAHLYRIYDSNTGHGALFRMACDSVLTLPYHMAVTLTDGPPSEAVEYSRLTEIAQAARAYLSEAKRMNPHVTEQNPLLDRLARALND